MKKFIIAFLAMTVILASLSIVSSAFEIVLPDYEFGDETVYAPGDVDCNGEIDSVDLANLSRYLAGGAIEITGNGDMNDDGEVIANDLASLRRYLAGGAS